MFATGFEKAGLLRCSRISQAFYKLMAIACMNCFLPIIPRSFLYRAWHIPDENLLRLRSRSDIYSQILTFSESLLSQTNAVALRVDDLYSGVYYLEILDENEIVIRKFVKE